ncbi:MAG: hypothetical protein HYV09_17735 [Deltaproteobacteria bacterium]|nr:hypothetical protein [Deltaproteobacteria bacterium]
MITPLIAAARMVEERVRTSRRLRAIARAAMVVLARLSPEARDYVRIRVRRIV